MLLLAASAVCAPGAHAQAYTPPPPKLVPGPCVPTKDFPCDPPVTKVSPPPAASGKFPFPGADPGSDPDAQPTTPDTTTPATSTDPVAKPASGQFPYPGDSSSPQTAPAPADGKKPNFAYPGDPGASSSSSSNDGGNNPDNDGAPADQPPLRDAGSTGSTRFQRKHLAKVEDLDHRELEDLDVSHYYLTTGNYTAAYLRAEDALKLYPEDENAHFAVAASAEKLGKKDVALTEYQAYLKLAPDGTNAKQAKRSLETLVPK